MWLLGLLAGPLCNLREVLSPQGVWHSVSGISSCILDIRRPWSVLVPEQAKLPVLLVQQGTAVQTNSSSFAAHNNELLASLAKVADD